MIGVVEESMSDVSHCRRVGLRAVSGLADLLADPDIVVWVDVPDCDATTSRSLGASA